jgi:hypothetical protein
LVYRIVRPDSIKKYLGDLCLPREIDEVMSGAEVRAQAHGWTAFCFRCEGCLLESGDLAFKDFGFLFRIVPVDGIQGVASNVSLASVREIHVHGRMITGAIDTY